MRRGQEEGPSVFTTLTCSQNGSFHQEGHPERLEGYSIPRKSSQRGVLLFLAVGGTQPLTYAAFPADMGSSLQNMLSR